MFFVFQHQTIRKEEIIIKIKFQVFFVPFSVLIDIFSIKKKDKCSCSLTYTTRVITALLSPAKSKSLNVKLIAIGLFNPC